MADPTDTVTLVSPEGKATDVPLAQKQAYLDQHFTPQGDTQRAESVASQTVAQHTSAAKAGAYALARGATFGGSDLLLSDDQKLDAQAAQSVHPYVSLGGEVAGTLLTGGATAGRLGESVAEGLGGGLIGKAVGGVVEGGVYGGGNAVSELALSDDPLTAEHVASTLSSNMLLGGAIGGIAHVGSELVQRGLARAGEKLADASATKAALDSVPADLAGLDEKGLADAAKTAASDHAASIDAEKASLEDLRTNQRAELANQVKDLHESLATERPISSVLTTGDELTPALKGIDGVADARVQLAKSYGGLRTQLDNPIAIARDPGAAIRPLEMRQGALETLQEKMPEIQAALSSDARAGVLQHVDDALAETKQQIADIRSLNSKANPVTSGRLTMLESGPSERMQQIAAARDALKAAPEMGMVGKAAKAGTFGGVTALAHMIPGVGILAPFLGSAASEAIGRLFTRTAGVVGKVGEKASAVAEKFLGAAKAIEPYAAPTATKVLSAVRFGPTATEGAAKTGSELGDMYRARSKELFQQTEIAPDGSTQMRQDARAAMAKPLDPIRAVNPILADRIETIQARKLAYLAENTPKRPDDVGPPMGPDTWRPSDLEIREWARRVRAVENPGSVEQRLARGIITPEEIDAYKTVYPERMQALQAQIFEMAPAAKKALPMNKKVALSIFTGMPVTRAMQPNVMTVLQSTFEVEPGSQGGTQAPGPQPSFGKFGSLKDTDKPTPSQERAGV